MGFTGLNQGIRRAIFLLEALGKPVSVPCPVSRGCQYSLTSTNNYIIPTSASLLTAYSLILTLVPPFDIKILVIKMDPPW
jgi:hypothetical protein